MSRARLRAVIAVLVIAGGVPVALLAWIGGVVLADRLGLAVSSEQIFTGLLALLIGTVVWPLALRRLRRELWLRENSVPAPAPTRGDGLLRVLIVICGSVGILVLCAPRDVVAAVTGIWAAVSVGPREDGILLQLVLTLVSLLLAAPALFVTGYALRRLDGQDPRRLRWQERRNWYTAAAVAWAVSLGLGLVLSVAALLTL